MIIRLLVFFCLLALPGALSAQENSVRDSLLVRLETATDHNEERLSVLYALADAMRGNLEECRKYTEDLLAEAELQNNGRYKCEAYLSLLLIAYNSYKADEVQRIAAILVEMARREKLYDIMFKAWRCSIDFMILSQDFERNEKEAKRMLGEAERLSNAAGILEASQALSNLYRVTYRKEQAVEVLEEALPLAYQRGDLGTIMNIWQQLLFVYPEIEEGPKWIEALRSFDAYIHSLPNNGYRTEQPMLLILYASYVDYYTRTRDWENARAALETGEKFYPEVKSPLYLIVFDRNACNYYCGTGQYEKALGKIDKVLANVEALSSRRDYYTMLPIKAFILQKLGRYAEAADLYRESIIYNDHLQTGAIGKQYEELKRNFNSDQQQLEAARFRFSLQLYMLILLILALLVVGGFIFYVFRSHRALRRGEAEMRVVTRRMELANEAKNRFLSNVSTTIRGPLNAVVEGSMRLASHQAGSRSEQQRLTQDIRRMSADLLKMINDILDLSRLEAGMMRFDMRDTEVSSLLAGAASVAGTSANRIEIRPEYPDNTLFMADLDAARLQQVFETLLMPPKTRSVIVVTVREADKVLHIRVAGSALAQGQPPQDIVIRNEINRMLVTRFGGSYTISEEAGVGLINLTIPIREVIRV